jgi:predicted Zn-dependent protease
MAKTSLLTESLCKDMIDLALGEATKLAKSRGLKAEAELTITSTNVATSRFANNEMTQNQAPSLDLLSVRVIANGRQARQTGEDLSEDGVRQLVQEAFNASQLLADDPDLPPMIKGQAPQQVQDKDKNVAAKGPVISKSKLTANRYDTKTASMTAGDRASAIKGVIALAQAKEASAAGIYATGARLQCIGNSRGLFQYCRETLCEFSVTIVKDGATGWAKAQRPQAGAIDVADLTERALDKALRAQQPGEIVPGNYTAILEPAAVMDLLAYLWWDFAGTSHTDQLSCLIDKVGKKVFDERINIVDDAHHAMSSGCPFDGEGLPRQRVELVNKGVLKNLVHGRRSANRFGLAPTGHGLPEPSPIGEYPLNLIVESDQECTTTVADMIAGVGPGEQAVLLTRVWYVREVDPSTKLLTGMTRDGTFLVENGKVVKALKNLRFNVSVLELLNNVLLLGQPVVTAGEEGFPPAVIPPMMVKDFNFTEVTKF